MAASEGAAYAEFLQECREAAGFTADTLAPIARIIFLQGAAFPGCTRPMVVYVFYPPGSPPHVVVDRCSDIDGGLLQAPPASEQLREHGVWAPQDRAAILCSDLVIPLATPVGKEPDAEFLEGVLQDPNVVLLVGSRQERMLSMRAGLLEVRSNTASQAKYEGRQALAMMTSQTLIGGVPAVAAPLVLLCGRLEERGQIELYPVLQSLVVHAVTRFAGEGAWKLVEDEDGGELVRRLMNPVPATSAQRALMMQQTQQSLEDAVGIAFSALEGTAFVELYRLAAEPAVVSLATRFLTQHLMRCSDRVRRMYGTRASPAEQARHQEEQLEAEAAKALRRDVGEERAREIEAEFAEMQASGAGAAAEAAVRRLSRHLAGGEMLVEHGIGGNPQRIPGLKGKGWGLCLMFLGEMAVMPRLPEPVRMALGYPPRAAGGVPDRRRPHPTVESTRGADDDELFVQKMSELLDEAREDAPQLDALLQQMEFGPWAVALPAAFREGGPRQRVADAAPTAEWVALARVQVAQRERALQRA